MIDRNRVAALYRRSGIATQERILFLLFCLDEVGFGTSCHRNALTSPNKDGSEKKSEYNIASIPDASQKNSSFVEQFLFFSLTPRPPRFIFAVGPGNLVLRSHDRGKTWRRLHICEPNLPKVTDEDIKEVTTSSSDIHSGDHSDLLKEVNLVSPLSLSAMSSSDVLEEMVISPSNETRHRLECISCLEDWVAIGGNACFLIISNDKGSHFHSLSVPLENMTSEKLKSVSNIPHTDSYLSDQTIYGLAWVPRMSAKDEYARKTESTHLPSMLFSFLSCNPELFIHTRHDLFRLPPFATDTELEWKHHFEAPILTMKIFPKASFNSSHPISSTSESPVLWELIISTPNMLYITWNDWSHFLCLKHPLGSIRAFVPLPYKCNVSPKSSGSISDPELSSQATYTSSLIINDSALLPFSKLSNPMTQNMEELSSKAIRWTFFSNGDASKERQWVVYTTDLLIVPYDLTAVLCLSSKSEESKDESRTEISTDSEKTVVSSSCEVVFFRGAHISYIPFVRSRLTDCVGLALLHLPYEKSGEINHSKLAGKKSFRLLRTGTFGFSFSDDLGCTWSMPKGAGMGKPLILDGGEVLLCGNRRPIISKSTNFGKSFLLDQVRWNHSRSTAIYDMDTMW